MTKDQTQEALWYRRLMEKRAMEAYHKNPTDKNFRLWCYQSWRVSELEKEA